MKISMTFGEDASWFAYPTNLHPQPDEFEVPDDLWQAYLDAVALVEKCEAGLLHYKPSEETPDGRS